MIGKIQRLKNKKGFTIVELLIVIAIIGVLAAILIPLMSDYLNKARVTSADAAASAYRTQISAFLTERVISNDARGETRPVGYIYVTVDSSGTHTINTANGICTDGTWTAFQNDSNNIRTKFNKQLTDNIKDIKNSRLLFVLEGNTCVAAMFSPSTELDYTKMVGYYNSSTRTLQNVTDGITNSDGGIIIGFK